MLVQGQVEIRAVFSRIGHLNYTLNGVLPYEDVDVPVGTVWHDGDEYIALHCLEYWQWKTSERSGKPTWVLELPPDGELVAVWCDGIRTPLMESWSWDYPEGCDLTGFNHDTGMCWWDEWFERCEVPGGDHKHIPEFNDIHWDFLMRALVKTKKMIRTGWVPQPLCGGVTQLTAELRQYIEDWRSSAIAELHNNPYGFVEIPTFHDMCGWCLKDISTESEHPTHSSLLICKDCGKEYDEESRLIQLERERVERLYR